MDGIVGAGQGFETEAGTRAEGAAGPGAAGQPERQDHSGGQHGTDRGASHAAGSGSGTSIRPALSALRSTQLHTPQHTQPGGSRPQKLMSR